jgi:hypothetical protein
MKKLIFKIEVELENENDCWDCVWLSDNLCEKFFGFVRPESSTERPQCCKDYFNKKKQ